MTDHDEQLDARLRRLTEGLRVPPAPSLDSLVTRRRGLGRTWRATAVAAAAVLLVGGGAFFAARLGSGSSEVRTGPAATVTTTEPRDRPIPTQPAGPTTTVLAQDGSCAENTYPALTSLLPGDGLTGQSGFGLTTIRISVPPAEPDIAADRSWMTIEIRPTSSLREVLSDVQVTTSTGAAVTATLSQEDVAEGNQDHTLRQITWADGSDQVLVQSFNVDVDRMLERLRSFELVDRPEFLRFLDEHDIGNVCNR